MAESSVPGLTGFGSGISLGGAVLWDVDGTLVESTDMAFNATNEVLEAAGHPAISVENYNLGCR